ncbi:unnamed protein product [Rotaria socialis]|uniref:Uncharacterized protein n=1 Tax=Rotaria socialis TaxID=392032 RepID=A0A820YYV5_9BILA|nr:unnamed protein product [Rotaria socialis]CAF4553382.1 unnamed protein product [Rotaria socialis]
MPSSITNFFVTSSLSSKLTEVLEKYMYNAYEQVALPLSLITLIHGQFICNQCTVFNTAERDDWLKHVRKYHYSAFVRLVREREGCPTALNDQPLANISDNEDDDDDDDETANIGTPRFEFDALTASTDSHRLPSQRRFQPSRPASGAIPRDFIPQRQFQPNCPPPNINQYCFIPQQQFQPNHATTGTIPRDFISQQLEQNHHATASTYPGDFISQQQLQFGNTTADPLQQSQVSQTERKAQMMKLVNDLLANIITNEEYMNAMAQLVFK